MRKLLYILLIPIIGSCNSEEFTPEQVFVGTYEMQSFAIYDENDVNIMDYLLLAQPNTIELTLNRDGTYYLTEGAEPIVVFCNGNFSSTERGGVTVGIWEVSDFALSFHFDRGEFESVVEYVDYGDGLYFYQFADPEYSFDLEFQLYDLGYAAGEALGLYGNENDSFDRGLEVGYFYGNYAGYYDFTPLDEFGLSSDLIYNYSEGFFDGFSETYLDENAATFYDGFFTTYDVYYNEGSNLAVSNSSPNRSYIYFPEYDFIRK